MKTPSDRHVQSWAWGDGTDGAVSSSITSVVESFVVLSNFDWFVNRKILRKWEKKTILKGKKERGKVGKMFENFSFSSKKIIRKSINRLFSGGGVVAPRDKLSKQKKFSSKLSQTHGFMKLWSLGNGSVELAHFGGQALFGQLRHRGRRVERLGHFSFAFHVIDVDVLGELLSADVTGLDFHSLLEHLYVQLGIRRKIGLIIEKLKGLWRRRMSCLDP